MGELLEQPHCKACFKPLRTEPVMILNGPRYSGAQWVESSIQRCANSECCNTTGGTLEERIAYINGVYGYKYFGDYELSPEQMDAVGEAVSLAAQVPSLVAVLADLLHENSTKSAEDRLRTRIAAEAAIAKALGQDAEGVS